MALPLILLVTGFFAAVLAFQGLDNRSLLQALFGASLAWAGLQAWWRKQAELHKRSGVDEASGLASDSAFVQRLRQEMARLARSQGRASLMLIRLSPEAGVEHRHGGGSEARVVAAAAATIKTATRSVDVAGRLGDGRLAVLMPDTPIAGARQAGKKLVAAFGRQKLKLPDGTQLGGKGETLAQALDRAQAALNTAIVRGRNTVEAH